MEVKDGKRTLNGKNQKGKKVPKDKNDRPEKRQFRAKSMKSFFTVFTLRYLSKRIISFEFFVFYIKMSYCKFL